MLALLTQMSILPHTGLTRHRRKNFMILYRAPSPDFSGRTFKANSSELTILTAAGVSIASLPPLVLPFQSGLYLAARAPFFFKHKCDSCHFPSENPSVAFHCLEDEVRPFPDHCASPLPKPPRAPRICWAPLTHILRRVLPLRNSV